MKSMNKQKYELMSQCLKHFKQLPQNLQQYSRNSNETLLQKIVQCSYKFIEIANCSGDSVQTEIPLYHRFFCRIRDLIYSFIAYYLHLEQWIFIKELFMDINKLLLQYRPGVGYQHVLMQIGFLIKNSASSIVANSKMYQESLEKIFNNFSFAQETTFQFEDQNKVIKRLAFRAQAQAREKDAENTNKAKTKVQKIQTMKQKFCYDAIFDIDRIYFDNLSKSTSSLQASSQCISRNRQIKQIISKYYDQYRAYHRRSQNSKNKQSFECRPTSFSKAKKQYNKDNKRHISTSHQKRHQIQIDSLGESMSFFKKSTQQINSIQVRLRQEVINNMYAFRQKCCLKRVMIGVQQISRAGIRFSRDIEKSNEKQKCGKVEEIRKTSTERTKTYTQRFKVMKNSRCYISGVVSVPFNKNDI